MKRDFNLFYQKFKLNIYKTVGFYYLPIKSLNGEKQNFSILQPEKTEGMHKILKEWREFAKAPVPTRLNPLYGIKGK